MCLFQLYLDKLSHFRNERTQLKISQMKHVSKRSPSDPLYLGHYKCVNNKLHVTIRPLPRPYPTPPPSTWAITSMSTTNYTLLSDPYPTPNAPPPLLPLLLNLIHYKCTNSKLHITIHRPHNAPPPLLNPLQVHQQRPSRYYNTANPVTP